MTKARRLLATTALASLLALGLLMLVPPLLGYQRYVITGGSMGGSLPRGSIAYEEVVPTSRIAKDDVITYRPPGADRLLTHRVNWIWRDRSGRRVYRTRGDANPAPDRWTFLLPHKTQARLAFHVPLAGYSLTALSIREVRMAVIGGPALAIAFFAFASLRRDRRGRRGRRREHQPSYG
jgi:signal peptidase